MVGTGAVIATARHVPAAMMLTREIDIYPDGSADPDAISDLIDASIGHDSLFDRTFGYCGGVGPRTAIMPMDWRTRAIEYRTPNGEATALCPSAEDVAIAKLCAWREKDQSWLREAVRARIAALERIEALLTREMPPEAPAADELLRRLRVLGR